MSTPPESKRPSSAASPALGALIGLVTLIAVLLVCNVKVRMIEWGFEYPLMLQVDPTHALFNFAEGERRAVQSGLIPRWLTPRGMCSACDAASLEMRWRELFDEHQRIVDLGYRPKENAAGWTREAEAAREISLAGWGDPQHLEQARTHLEADLPDYLAYRVAELKRGALETERQRARQVGRDRLLEAGFRFALVLFALATVVAWKLGYHYPRRAARARLAAPTLGRGLLVFIWAEAFVSVLTRLRLENPDSILEVFHAIPGLALALSVSVLFLGTRPKSSDSPINALLYCPPDRRSRRAFWIAAVASIGLIYGFNWLHWRSLNWLGFLPSWADGMNRSSWYQTTAEAIVSRIGTVVVVPFGEELTYRGALFGSLATRMSAHRAALLSCLIFAAMHGYGWFGFASVALSGYLWARLAARTGSLVPGMVAHSLFNLVIAFAELAYRF